jgi:NAD dependent epimerase/dehydratase family enzyme
MRMGKKDNGRHGGRIDFDAPPSNGNGDGERDGDGSGKHPRRNGTKVLITGGAGFIGSHLADELLAHGYVVRALDNLSPQVHGPGRRRPDYLNPDVELIVGDVRDPKTVRSALAGVDGVYHLAAAVGVGQSMYEIASYTSLNNLGTAVLLEALIERAKTQPVQRLVVASSMSIYGEGLYRAPDGSVSRGIERTAQQLRKASSRRWRRCTRCRSSTRSACASWSGGRTGSRRWRCGSSTSSGRARR